MVKLPRTIIVSLMVFTFPSAIYLPPFICDNLGAGIHIVPSAVTFAIPSFIWSYLSTSSCKFEMQDLQVIKCAFCDTIFMSETNTAIVHHAQSKNHSHHEHGTGSTMGSCGCRH